MGSVIADLLPLGLGIAANPVTVTAVVLLLLSQQPTRNSRAFLVGYVSGILVVTVVVLVVVEEAQDGGGGPSTLSAVIALVLGLLLLGVAVWKWRQRAAKGEPDAEPPGWMSSLDTISPVKAVGLGVLLSVVNPKNLLLVIGAGTVVASAELSASSTVATAVIFVAASTSTVAVPVVAHGVAGDRLAEPLVRFRGWLLRNGDTVMAAVTGILGLLLAVHGGTGLAG